MIAAVVGLLLLAIAPLQASRDADFTGRVTFNGIGVPGAAVTLKKDARTLTTVSGEDGSFRVAAIDDGAWALRVEMRGFVTATQDVTLPLAGPPLTVVLALLPLEAMLAPAPGDVAAAALPPPAPLATTQTPDETAIINGSVINGAATPFAQPRAFGNNRPNQRPIYAGAINVLGGNSALNARPYSFSTSDTPQPSYNDLHLGGMLSGPMRIPWLFKNGPQTSVSYQHAVNHNALTQSALMPTEAERRGDFSQSATALRDPRTGQPFDGNIIPVNRISPQAASLLAYYPLPNAETTIGANFQRPVLTSTTEDRAQIGMQKPIGRRDTVAGTVSFQRSASTVTSLFGFEDKTVRSSIDATAGWTHRLSTRVSARLRYQFTRTATTTTPYFADRIDVSGDAGITGNDQEPQNWGPPLLSFPDIADLRDAIYERSISRAHAAGAELLSNRGRHNMTVGGDVRWTHVDVRAQQDPRGGLSFTGALTGSAFADFLLGVPATASIAFGNADKRLRGMSYDAYFNDDWRLGAALTLNLGVRWEYESPFSEAGGRLINLDIAPDFSSAAPVPAALRRDWLGIQPRLGLSWRPIPASSLVIRGSYGLYRNTNVYQPLAMLLAQQPPLSKTYSIQNTPQSPLTMADAFTYQPAAASNTFAIDPYLRVGIAQNWQASVQRELPADLTATVVYLGARGDRLVQASLPNTNPPGAVDPCPACPSGFVYLTSGGTSLRNALQLTLRRRLRYGLTTSVQYTFSRSTDDASTFTSGAVSSSALAIAQDWRDLGAERGPSPFDQPHLTRVEFQYTTGVGVTGGTLIDGFWGSLYKDWTITSTLIAGSGLPSTPIFFATVPGTGVVGVRPRLTGETTAPPSSNAFANPAAYTAPLAGAWGDAGRNSIRGPRQFSLDAAVSRTFRLGPKLNLEYRVDVTNLLNRVTFSAINRVISSPQFGLPTAANAMRRLQLSARLRF